MYLQFEGGCINCGSIRSIEFAPKWHIVLLKPILCKSDKLVGHKKIVTALCSECFDNVDDIEVDKLGINLYLSELKYADLRGYSLKRVDQFKGIDYHGFIKSAEDDPTRQAHTLDINKVLHGMHPNEFRNIWNNGKSDNLPEI